MHRAMQHWSKCMASLASWWFTHSRVDPPLPTALNRLMCDAAADEMQSVHGDHSGLVGSFVHAS